MPFLENSRMNFMLVSLAAAAMGGVFMATKYSFEQLVRPIKYVWILAGFVKSAIDLIISFCKMMFVVAMLLIIFLLCYNTK
jgi:hypothetical protein